MDETDIVVPGPGGVELQVRRWAPEGTPRAVVQVQHGLGEHSGRYRRFAEALTGAGYLVYAPDARGSGRTAPVVDGTPQYGSWGDDGWLGWVGDVDALNQRIHTDNPGLPVVLFGHSMGSFASQQYVLDHSADIDALVLCGTTDAAAIVEGMSGSEDADLSDFNAPFEHRTGFEWLSRDEVEVDKYVADEACGWQAPVPTHFDTLAQASDAGRVAGVRKDLPVLVIAGTDDPVGGGEGAGPTGVAGRYRAVGMTDVDLVLYPHARHELLNETNRDEVTANVLSFLERVTSPAAQQG